MPTRSNVIRRNGDVLEIVMTQGRKAIVDADTPMHLLHGKRWYCAGRRSKFIVGYTVRPGQFVTLAAALGLPPVHANGDMLDHRRANMVDARVAAKLAPREWPYINADEGSMRLGSGHIAYYPPQYVNQVSGYRWRYIPGNDWTWPSVKAVINGKDVNLARYIWQLAGRDIPEGMAVRCINGNRLDCRLDNLELFKARIKRLTGAG